MPPGLNIDSKNGLITGVVPDLDALYSFTIRATNVKDKYEDAVFRMEIIGTRFRQQESSTCLINSIQINRGLIVFVILSLRMLNCV